ncbi:hypothetical protein [Polaribacter sp.]|jgi:hypothetical protein|uniref:hypothetical protein n=1 Tax=Polaribacter sp. TaxID=1920175 RepID=UPI004048C575
MKLIKNLGLSNILMLGLCVIIILISEFLFLTGEELHGIFIGLWAPTFLGVMIYLKLVKNERR